MLRILGSRKTLCDGFSRRDFLQVGGLGALGIGLEDLLRAESAQAAFSSKANFGQAKACILLFPYGSPPQHETFDPKPNAPYDVQGEMGAISTSVPGTFIGEGLPNIAKIMDKVTVVRSVTHRYPLHCVAYTLSGLPTYSVALENSPRDLKHWPFIGSVVDYLDERRTGITTPVMPRNIGLPWRMTSKTDNNPLAGPYAAYLGQAYDPIWTDFVGEGTKLAPKSTSGQRREYLDPHMGITSEGKFLVSKDATLPPDISLERLGLRRALLAQFDRQRAALDLDPVVQSHDRYREMAFSMLTTGKMRESLDVAKEDPRTREQYGMTLFGQGCLAARRMVEAGCRFVTVFWDCYGEFSGGAWDTHENHYPRLKNCLLPGFDLAYSGLINDLEQRGLFDETLVACFSEHGRTPKIDWSKMGAGRDHWSNVYSAVFAGAGVPQGKIVGASDRNGGEVLETPVSPKDLLATTYHLLGIDPTTLIPDHQNRPLPIAGEEARVRPELLA